MSAENEHRQSSRNDAIRAALAAEALEQTGPLVVTDFLEVRDAEGNLRLVECVGPAEPTPED